MTHPRNTRWQMHHSGTGDSVPSLVYKNARSDLVPARRLNFAGLEPHLCRGSHARDVSLCETLVLTPQMRAPARGWRGIPGAGGWFYLDLGSIFPGRPPAPRRRPFYRGSLSGQPKQGGHECGNLATLETLFTAGELRDGDHFARGFAPATRNTNAQSETGRAAQQDMGRQMRAVRAGRGRDKQKRGRQLGRPCLLFRGSFLSIPWSSPIGIAVPRPPLRAGFFFSICFSPGGSDLLLYRKLCFRNRRGGALPMGKGWNDQQRNY